MKEASFASHVAPIFTPKTNETYLEGLREGIDQHLGTLLAKRYPTTDAKAGKLAEAIAYSLVNGGKRIRPIITLAVSGLYRPLNDEAFALALTTELIHTATLMLDDLPSMDDAMYRRGKLANHRVFGESTTILAALALWSEAVRILSTVESVEINEIVRETAESVGRNGLVRGQFLDLDSFRKAQTMEDLEECYLLKTAALFKNAAKIGAVFGHASREEQVLFERFGRTFGFMYQIHDDILDAQSSLEKEGKDVGVDEKNGRTTYVTLLGVAGAQQLMQKKITATLHELERLPYDIRHLIGMVQSLERV